MNKYIIEYEVTKDCNFNCTYCFEHGHQCKVNSDIDDEFISFVRKCQSEIQPEIEIVFWGGEPSLNMKSIRAVHDAFKDDVNVSFMTYTNGYYIFDLIDIVKSNIDRWSVQVSYDGEVIHNINRTDPTTDTPTSNAVMDSYSTLFNMGANVSLKSTLPLKDVDKMYDTWLEFTRIFDQTGAMYAPTIDGTHTPEYFNKFKDQISKIMQGEYRRYKAGKGVVFNWIHANNDSKCGNGENYVTVDVNGTIYPCHGALYGNSGCELTLGTIFDDDIIESLNLARVKYEKAKMNKPMKCVGCTSLNCHICNMSEFDHSCKCEFAEKLNDRSNIKHCAYFKHMGKYGRVFLKITNGGL